MGRFISEGCNKEHLFLTHFHEKDLLGKWFLLLLFCTVHGTNNTIAVTAVSSFALQILKFFIHPFLWMFFISVVDVFFLLSLFCLYFSRIQSEAKYKRFHENVFISSPPQTCLQNK